MSLQGVAVFVLFLGFFHNVSVASLAMEGERVPPPWWLRCSGQIVSILRMESQRLNQEGREIPVPYGVAAPEFASAILEAFVSHPGVEAMVFHGSRTHFDYGYLPQPRSDLDVVVFFVVEAPRDLDRLLAEQLHVAFPVNIKIRSLGDLTELAQTRGFQFPATRAEDKALQTEAYRRASRSILGRGDWKQSWSDLVAIANPATLEDRLACGHDGFSALCSAPPAIISYGKQSIVFLRKGEGTLEALQGLRAADFRNLGLFWEEGDSEPMLELLGTSPFRQ